MKLYVNVGLNTLYQVAARFVTAIVGLIAIRLITGTLGVDGFGNYQIVVTYVTLFWILTDFGLNAIAVREMAADEKNLPEVFAALITLRGMLGLLLVAVSWFVLLFLPYSVEIKWAIIIASSTIFFQSLLGSANGLFQVKLRYDRQLISNMLGSTVSLSLVVHSVRNDWGLYGFVIAFASTSLVMALVNALLAHQWVTFKFSRDKNKLKYLFRETLPFGTALLFSLATFKLDALMLSALPLQSIENNVAIGVYNLAYKVFELILIFPVFFMNPIYPILVKHKEESFEKFKKSVYKTFGALAIVSIMVIVVLYPSAPKIIGLLADTVGFEPSIGVLRVLVLWTPLFFVTALLMWILVTLRCQRELIFIYLTAFLFNLTSNLVFIPRYHYWAAAYITGATEVIILTLLVLFVLRAWQKESKEANHY